MSGDYNTALGNCLLMTAMAFNVFQSLGIKYDIMDDGDDCLIIIDKRDRSKLDCLPQRFLDFGHELKVENLAEYIEDVRFCQSAPIYDGVRWRFVRDYKKVLANAATGFAKLRDVTQRRRMLYAIGVCELSLNRGIPVLQELALKLISLGERPTEGVKEYLDKDPLFKDLSYRVRNINLCEQGEEIAIQTRWSFYRAFKLTNAQQEMMEDTLRDWRPDIFATDLLPFDQAATERLPDDIVLAGTS